MESIDFDSLDLEALSAFYYDPQPPYLLLIGGLLAAILSGLAFQTVLKELLMEWQANRATQSLAKMRGWQLLTPYLGMAGGSIFFLAAGVEWFGLPRKLAYGVAVPMTLFIGWLVWWQLGKILEQIEAGGSAALDLDN
jgi:uncharacterized protein (DUF2062 family)